MPRYLPLVGPSLVGSAYIGFIAGALRSQRRRSIWFRHSSVTPARYLAPNSALGAFHTAPPLRERRDLAKLRVPELRLNRATSDLWLRVAEDTLGDLLTVRRRGCFWTIIGGLPVTAVQLRGMEALWLDLCDAPEWVREFLAVLARAHHEMLDALERENVLALNNEAEWVGTGGLGYSDELPAPGFDPARVRLGDLWGGLQAQDLVGLSPRMFADFFYPVIAPVLARFGLAHFGCCEPLDGWLPTLMQSPNLRRVSISPWANVRRCAEQLRDRYVMCYKPLPTPLTTETMDEAALLRTYTDAFRATREHGCHVEIMAKDLHTVRHDPQRLRRWVAVARRAAADVYG